MKDFDIENIILRSLKKDALAPEELRELEEWLAKPEHRRQYQEWRRLEAGVYATGKSREINLQAAWEKLKKRIQVGGRRRIWSIVPYAAVLVLLVGAGVILMLRQEVLKPVPVANRIAPEALENQIVLTLSDGKQVVLSDSLGMLQELNGTLINQEERSLVYNATDSSVAIAYNTVSIPWGRSTNWCWLTVRKFGLTRKVRLRIRLLFMGKPVK